MKIKHYLLLLLFCSLASRGFSQMTIATKFGGVLHQPTYIYDGISYHDKYNNAGLAFALAFRREVGHRFALGTELGFNTFTNYLEIRTATQYIQGKHLHQQAYLALVPQYSLTKRPGLVFLNAGFLLVINTKSELEDSFEKGSMDVGATTSGVFAGLGFNPQIGKLGIQLEIRPTFQSQASYVASYGGPDKFKLRYTNIFWGLTYHLD